jgi:hypothetical protein
MRTTKELLQIMLNNQNLFDGGLCRWAFNLWENRNINYNELNQLNNYISTHPTLRGINRAYYWECGKIKPRIEWLKNHIQLQM